jgi:hypothetical protein
MAAPVGPKKVHAVNLENTLCHVDSTRCNLHDRRSCIGHDQFPIWHIAMPWSNGGSPYHCDGQRHCPLAAVRSAWCVLCVYRNPTLPPPTPGVRALHEEPW